MWHRCVEQTVLSRCDSNSRSEVSSLVKVCGSVFGCHNEFALIGTMAPPSSSTPPHRTLGRRSRSLSVPTPQNLKGTKDWVDVKGSLGGGAQAGFRGNGWIKTAKNRSMSRVLLHLHCWKCQFLKLLCIYVYIFFCLNFLGFKTY